MLQCCWHSPLPQGHDDEYLCCNATGTWYITLPTDPRGLLGLHVLCHRHLETYKALGYTPRVYRPVQRPNLN